MAAAFNPGDWLASDNQRSDEPYPSHHSASLPLHGIGQLREDHRSHLQPPFETPSSSGFLGNYAFPSQTEQAALSVLKDYPDHLLAKWFELARQDRSGISFSVFIYISNYYQVSRTLSRRLHCPYCIPPLHQHLCSRNRSLKLLQTSRRIMTLIALQATLHFSNHMGLTRLRSRCSDPNTHNH